MKHVTATPRHQPVKPKFHYADFHRNFSAGKVVDTNQESRGHKRWQITKSWSFGESRGQKQSRHVKMFATESVTSLWQTRLCRSNGILSITVHEESWWQSSRQSLRTLSCTQITKVSDMICVADFHDLCPRFYLQGSFSKSRKVGVMEFGLYQIYIAIPSLCSPAFNTYISVFYNAF